MPGGISYYMCLGGDKSRWYFLTVVFFNLVDSVRRFRERCRSTHGACFCIGKASAIVMPLLGDRTEGGKGIHRKAALLHVRVMSLAFATIIYYLMCSKIHLGAVMCFDYIALQIKVPCRSLMHSNAFCLAFSGLSLVPSRPWSSRPRPKLATKYAQSQSIAALDY